MTPCAAASPTGRSRASAATGSTVPRGALCAPARSIGRGEIGAQHLSTKPLLARQQRGDVERAGTQVDKQAVRVRGPSKLVERPPPPPAINVQTEDVIQ